MTPPQPIRWFFSWYAGPYSDAPATHGVMLRDVKWTWAKGLPKEISVAFLPGQGSDGLRAQVREVVGLWTEPGRANLRFRWEDDPTDADVRISFRSGGSWSTIGTTCKYVTDKTKATVNFGWLDDDSEESEVRRVVLHEFGHVLGLGHEHQRSDAGILWDKPRIYADLKESGWDPEKVDRNLFVLYAQSRTNTSPTVDPLSIMMYPVPREWTLGGGENPPNDDLSAGDIAFIGDQYS